MLSFYPQRTYDTILSDQKMLADGRDNNLHFAKEFDQRCTNMKAALKAEQQKQEQILEMEQVRMGFGFLCLSPLHTKESKCWDKICPLIWKFHCIVCLANFATLLHTHAPLVK